MPTENLQKMQSWDRRLDSYCANGGLKMTCLQKK